MTDHDRARPVLGDLDGFIWSTEAAVAYEAAIEAINGAVGAYTALIEAEESRAVPDPAGDSGSAIGPGGMRPATQGARSGRSRCRGGYPAPVR